MRVPLERIRSQVDLKNYSHALNLVHVETMFLGYMDTARYREDADNPFSPGGASHASWETGAAWARDDLGDVV